MKANIDLVSWTDNHLKGWHSQMKKMKEGEGSFQCETGAMQQSLVCFYIELTFLAIMYQAEL